MSGPYKLRAGTPLRVRARQIAAGQDAEDPAARAALSVGLKPKAFTEASEKVRFRGRNREFLDARCAGLMRLRRLTYHRFFADLIQRNMYACKRTGQLRRNRILVQWAANPTEPLDVEACVGARQQRNCFLMTLLATTTS